MVDLAESAPETLDLVERANLAINAMTRCTNADNDYACWFYVSIYRNPPVADRQLHLYGKFMEALALTRRMTGNDLNTHVRPQQARLVRHQGHDEEVHR